MPSITALKGRIVYNSKGNATIEIDVITDGRFLGSASAPSGASIGKHEAQSFPENNPRKALDVFNTNMKKFVGINPQDPKQIFEALKAIDDTETYTKVGGSVAYALSVAAIDSAAKALD